MGTSPDGSSHPASTDTWLLEKRVPHSCSVIAATLRVETPWMYISIRLSTNACSVR